MKTDMQLKQDVITELNWEPSVNAAAIGVEVKDGIVTLAGHVDSYGEKWKAEHAAQQVTGVRGLATEVDVKLSGSSTRTDGDIARTAENVLQWTTCVPHPDAVKVMVESGWVTLTGEVNWDFQRKAAAGAIRYLMGVKGVSDQVKVKPKVTASAVKTDIEAALKRRASADTNNISVAVSGGDVTLSGSVHSWSERDLADDSAWGSQGVRNVVNNISVAF